MSRSEKFLATLFFTWDALILLLVLSLSTYIYQEDHLTLLNEWFIFAGLATMMAIWCAIGYWQKLYYLKNDQSLISRPTRYLQAYLILIITLVFCYQVFALPMEVKKIILIFAIGFPILGFTTNFFLSNMIRRIQESLQVRRALIAGVGNTAANLQNYYQSKPNRFELNGFITCKKEIPSVQADRIVGDVDTLDKYLSENEVDEIVIAIPIKPSKKIRKILAAADYHGKRVRYIPDYSQLLGNNCKPFKYGELDAINHRQMPLDESISYVLKEIFDLLFSLFVLLLLLPLLILIAIAIKFDSPGPILYCPTRIGKGGKPFKVFKFRTMQENDDTNMGTRSTEENDPRITRIGKFLRKYSLDELPQFLNVFFGDMSVVGPRPHRSQLDKQFQENAELYMLRHYFKPGITGWAQVNGWRGPTTTLEQKRQRTIHDIWYLENWTFTLDLKIIFLTVFGKKTHSSAF